MNFWQWLSYRLPKRLVYFCAIQVVSEATTGVYSATVVPELTAMDAIKRFSDLHRVEHGK